MTTFYLCFDKLNMTECCQPAYPAICGELVETKLNMAEGCQPELVETKLNMAEGCQPELVEGGLFILI